ncbi:MAG: ferritin [Pyrinomonadaceae bacterium MAG19_C2-C3]|nr:ferritin [Pyrinomonadaceae bacterium MAG19_C2-C3]
MLLSAALNDALNQQVGNEFGASLQYVAIAAYFDSDNLPVLARHFYTQATEERDHAMRFVKFIMDAGGRLEIPAIPAPRSDFSSAQEAVQLSLDWERTVTQQVNALVDRAIKDNDHISRNFLEWFVNEQLEEMASMETLLGMVRRAGDAGLLLVESYLAREGRSASVGVENENT